MLPLAIRKMARVTELRSKSKLESPIGQDKTDLPKSTIRLQAGNGFNQQKLTENV